LPLCIYDNRYRVIKLPGDYPGYNALHEIVLLNDREITPTMAAQFYDCDQAVKEIALSA
jgi:hypothetical protein